MTWNRIPGQSVARPPPPPRSSPSGLWVRRCLPGCEPVFVRRDWEGAGRPASSRDQPGVPVTCPGSAHRHAGPRPAYLQGLALWLSQWFSESTVVVPNQFPDSCQQPNAKARPEPFSDDKTSFLLMFRKCMRQEKKKKKKNKHFSSVSAGKMGVPASQYLC